MKVRWHVVAWLALLAGLAVWFWPLDPETSWLAMRIDRPPDEGPANTLDVSVRALFGDGLLDGTALLRLWIGGALIAVSAGIEIVSFRHHRKAEIDPPSLANPRRYQ